MSFPRDALLCSLLGVFGADLELQTSGAFPLKQTCDSGMTLQPESPHTRTVMSAAERQRDGCHWGHCPT